MIDRGSKEQESQSCDISLPSSIITVMSDDVSPKKKAATNLCGIGSDICRVSANIKGLP